MLRKYDPQIGRFAGVDLVAAQSPGRSPYHYGGNDPIFFNDPTGAFNLPPGLPGTAQRALQQFDDFSNEGSGQNLYQYESDGGGMNTRAGAGGSGGGGYAAWWSNFLGGVPNDEYDHEYRSDWEGDPQMFNNYRAIDGQWTFETPNWDDYYTTQEDIPYKYVGSVIREGLPEGENGGEALEMTRGTLDATIFASDLTQNGIVGAQQLANWASGTASPVLKFSEMPLARIGNLGKLTVEGGGRILGGFAVGLTIVDMTQHGVNWSNGTDLVFGLVAFIPVAGWAISGTYFLSNIIVHGVTGKSIGDHLGDVYNSPGAQSAINNWPITPNF